MYSEHLNPIIDIGTSTIDLRKVERIGNVYGDLQKYSIYFISGIEIEIYQERMKRETLVNMWKDISKYS